MEKNKKNKRVRYPFIDVARGFAVVQMIIFHIYFYAHNIGLNSYDFYYDPFWYWWPREIVGVFYFVVGLSMALVYREHFPVKKFTERLLKLGSGLVLITAGSYLINEDRFIYFGTLHCIWVMTLALIPFLNHPKSSFAWALVFMFAYHLANYPPFPRIPYSWLPGHYAYDYIPIFPWLAAGLLGVSAQNTNLLKWPMPKNTLIQTVLIPLEWCGKRAFALYFAHHIALVIITGIISGRF
jgi:uncharacterized membrane protein